MEIWCEEGNFYVTCYGELRDDSNFEVVCENEEDDGCWADGKPDGGSFATWEEVVNTLYKHFDSPIVEISAC